MKWLVLTLLLLSFRERPGEGAGYVGSMPYPLHCEGREVAQIAIVNQSQTEKLVGRIEVILNGCGPGCFAIFTRPFVIPPDATWKWEYENEEDIQWMDVYLTIPGSFRAWGRDSCVPGTLKGLLR